MMRKLLLTAIWVTFFNNTSTEYVTIAFITSMSSLFLHTLAQPYGVNPKILAGHSSCNFQ